MTIYFPSNYLFYFDKQIQDLFFAKIQANSFDFTLNVNKQN